LEHFLFFHILEIIIPTDNHQVAGFSVESTHFGGINEWLAKAKAWLWLQQLSLGGNSGWEHSCPCVAPEAVGPWSLSLGNFSGQSIRRTHPRYPCQPIQVPSWMGWGYNFGQKGAPQKDRTYIVLPYFTNMLRGFHSISLVLLVDDYTLTERQSARAATAASLALKAKAWGQLGTEARNQNDQNGFPVGKTMS